jgi:hypothetical protein
VGFRSQRDFLIAVSVVSNVWKKGFFVQQQLLQPMTMS